MVGYGVATGALLKVLSRRFTQRAVTVVDMLLLLTMATAQLSRDGEDMQLMRSSQKAFAICYSRSHCGDIGFGHGGYEYGILSCSGHSALTVSPHIL